MPAVTKRGRAGHRCLLSLASNLLQRSSGEFSLIVSGTFYSHGSSSMDTITTLIYSTRHLILSPCTWCIEAVLHCIHVWWDVLYMWVKKIRGMNKIYFFIRCLVDSELQSVSCVQCVNLINQRGVMILQIHRSIWLLIVRLWFDLIFRSFSSFFFSHCAGDYWFYTLRTFIYMCNVVDTTWKTPHFLQFSSCAIGIVNFLP